MTIKMESKLGDMPRELLITNEAISELMMTNSRKFLFVASHFAAFSR